MDQSDYKDVLNKVIEETQAVEKVERKSKSPMVLVLIILFIVLCAVAWFVVS